MTSNTNKDRGKNWESLRLKDLIFKIGSGITPKGGSEVYVEDGIMFLRSQNVHDDGLRVENVSYIDEQTNEQMKGSQIRPYDILLNITGASIGRTCIVPPSVHKANINQHILYLRIKKKKVDFLSYFLKSQFIKDHIMMIQAGSSKEGLSMGQALRLPIVIPEEVIQTEIANYLDQKTVSIDKKIELLEKKAEKYRELRKSLIEKAVTKGLDRNVELKDSGIEWIGEIPAHWNVLRIKEYTYVKARIGWQGLRSDEFMDEGDYRCVTGTDFKDGTIDWSNCHFVSKERFDQDKKIQLKLGDLLITKDGSIGKLALVKDLPEKTTLNSGVFVTRPLLKKYDNEFMYWLLSSSVFTNYIDLTKNGTTILHLYQNVFEKFIYPIPPIEEQKQISLYLYEKTHAIDSIIDNLQRQLDSLLELKKTLINDVVTGQLKVTA